MSRRRAVTGLLVRLALPVLAIVVVLGALPLYGRLTSSSRISPALREQLRAGQPSYSVRVELTLRPQYFNIQKLQSLGTLAGVKGTSVKVLDIGAAQVHTIADLYWVKQVKTIGES